MPDPPVTGARSPGAVFIGPEDLPFSDAEAVLDEAAIAEADLVTIDVSGPGAVQCMQGLLTNDIEAPGMHGFVYGAVLTPKGMIVCDMWVARNGGDVTVFAPVHGKQALLDTFQRLLPPRLASTADRSDELVSYRMVGPQSVPRAEDAGIAVPEPGQRTSGTLAGVGYVAARTSQEMPFTLQLTSARGKAHMLLGALERAGVVPANPAALELARILAGWPRLGAEIGEKTLPQEVRFDEIEGVSYTKGCYTGQETVARLHFRGHTNRRLAGLVFDGTPDPHSLEITRGEQAAGRVTSSAWVDRFEQYVGLGVVRREVELGAAVTAAGAQARTIDLPFQLEW